MNRGSPIPSLGSQCCPIWCGSGVGLSRLSQATTHLACHLGLTGDPPAMCGGADHPTACVEKKSCILARPLKLKLKMSPKEQKKVKRQQQPLSPPKKSSSLPEKAVTLAPALVISDFKAFQDLLCQNAGNLGIEGTFMQEKFH